VRWGVEGEFWGRRDGLRKSKAAGPGLCQALGLELGLGLWVPFISGWGAVAAAVAVDILAM